MSYDNLDDLRNVLDDMEERLGVGCQEDLEKLAKEVRDQEIFLKDLLKSVDDMVEWMEEGNSLTTSDQHFIIVKTLRSKING